MRNYRIPWAANVTKWIDVKWTNEVKNYYIHLEIIKM